MDRTDSLTAADLPAIEHRVFIDKAPADVFAALTTRRGLNSWFTTESSVDPGKGGSVSFHWHEYGPDRITVSDGGPILDFVQNQVFAFEWQPTDHATVVTFTFEPADHGTLLSLRETGYHDIASDHQPYMNVAVGWGEALALLKIYLEHGIAFPAGLVAQIALPESAAQR